MENVTMIELSEVELDDVSGGIARIGICTQSAEGACPGDCCGNA